MFSDHSIEIYTGSVFADIVSLFGLPTGTASKLFHEFLSSRAEAARDILFKELRSGKMDELHAANNDEAISVIYRYALAARDGAANRNLILLAKTMVGLAQRDRLYSDEFNKYAAMLSQLSRDQIFVLGRYYAIFEIETSKTTDSQNALTRTWERLVHELVSDQFETERHVLAVLAQSVSTGLILPNAVIGGTAYEFSPIMREVTELVRFQDALEGDAK